MRNEQKQKENKNKIKNNNNNKQYSIDQYNLMHDFYLMPKCCLFLWIVSSDGWHGLCFGGKRFDWANLNFLLLTVKPVLGTDH